VLFSESNTRFLAEIAPEDKRQFEEVMDGVDFAAIGEVKNDEKFEVYGIDKARVLSASIGELKESWQKPLRW